MRVRLFLLLWLLITPAVALEPFESALDAFEYERALGLIQKLPEGPRKDLALAQHAVISGRGERSFAYSDRIVVSQLPSELQAEYYLVRAYQEQATLYKTQEEKQKATERMIDEGLRVAEIEPRDRARLLLYRVETCPATALEPARRAAQNLSEMADINPRFALTAAARVEQSSEAFGKADILWKALADAALVAGEQRAADLYALNRCWNLAKLKRKPEAFAVASASLERALRRKDPVAALEGVFTAYVSNPEKGKGAEIFLPAIERMPDSFEKLQVIEQALYELQPSQVIGFPQRGAAMAEKLGEPLWQALFLMGMAYRESDPELAKEKYAKCQALLGAWDGRGAEANFFYRTLWRERGLELPDNLRSKSAHKPITEDWDKKLDEISDPLERTNYCVRCAVTSLSDGRPDLAEQAYARCVQEAEKLPPPERYRQVGSLINSPGPYVRSSEAPDDLLRLSWAGQRAVLAKIAKRPELVSSIVEAHMAMIGKEVSSNDLRSQREQLARWLAGLGRQEEAEELYGVILASVDAPRYTHSDQARTDRWTGQPGATERLWQTDQAMKTWWKTSVENGWWAIAEHRPDLAEKWARLAFETLGEGKRSDFLTPRPYALLATALARQAKIDEGLRVLEEGEARDPDPSWLAYAGSRVELLTLAGRTEEAAAALAALPAPTTPSETFRQLELRRNLAEAQGQKEVAAGLIAEMTALYRGSVTGLDDPVFAHFYDAAMADRLKIAVPSLPPATPSTLTFPELVEGLERLRRREPGNESLRLLSAADLRKVVEGAEPAELYVHPVLLQSSVALICLSRDKVDLIEVFCDRAKLDKEMSRLTTELASPGSKLESLEEPRRYLSRWLVRPWRERFPEKTQLRWLSQDQLRGLSVASLYDGDKELIDTVEVGFVDGPGHRQLSLTKDMPALLVGGAGDLVGAEAELAMVRKAFPKGESWTVGDPLPRLSQLAPGVKLIHIATHGMSPSGTRLAGALGGERGQVSAFDLSGLSFKPECLAVIGSCYSAVDGARGRDNSSLVSALRTAGAGVVVGSQWELEDDVTSRLFAHFYESLRAGASPEKALVSAQRAVRASYPHPYYWAGLQVVSGP